MYYFVEFFWFFYIVFYFRENCMSIVIECYDIKFNRKCIYIKGWDVVYSLLIILYNIVGYYNSQCRYQGEYCQYVYLGNK